MHLLIKYTTLSHIFVHDKLGIYMCMCVLHVGQGPVKLRRGKKRELYLFYFTRIHNTLTIATYFRRSYTIGLPTQQNKYSIF